MKQESYAALLRRGMRHKTLTKRGLEKALASGKGKSYSYEHVRRITSGTPVMSEQFNQDVCRVLGLDEDVMWQIALREKAKASTRPQVIYAPDPSVKTLWADLLPADRERVMKIVEGIAEQRRAEMAAQNTDDPESLRRHIHELTERLASRVTTPSRQARRG